METTLDRLTWCSQDFIGREAKVVGLDFAVLEPAGQVADQVLEVEGVVFVDVLLERFVIGVKDGLLLFQHLGELGFLLGLLFAAGLRHLLGQLLPRVFRLPFVGVVTI